MTDLSRIRNFSINAHIDHGKSTQVDCDLVDDGVCAVLIEEKLGLAQPTTAQHLKCLVDAGFLVPKRIKKWTFYKRDEAALERFMRDLAANT